MSLTLQHAMSNFPVTTKPGESLSTAYFRMREAGFRHLPVIDPTNNLVGIISDRDFHRAMWPTSVIDMVDAHGLPEMPTFKHSATVADYMSWPVRSLSPDDHLLTAARLMIDEKISAIIINKDDQMIGILTHEDLLRVLTSLLKEPGSLSEKAAALAYNSPLGMVFNLLNGAGI